MSAGNTDIEEWLLQTINRKQGYLELENQLLAEQVIDVRLKVKKALNEKINVVFVCQRPQIWGSLKSVYEAFLKDDHFNVTIVTIPTKKQLPEIGLSHEIYASEGAEDFWSAENPVHGYNYATGEWLDLRQLNPDYLFFQTPYNVTRSDKFKSQKVATYSKICYVSYGLQVIGGYICESVYPKDFMYNVSLFFLMDSFSEKEIREWFAENNNWYTRCFMTGCTRFDNIDSYRGIESSSWPHSHYNRFRIVWTPRWATDEGICTYYDYKDILLNWVKDHPDVDFVFRPHPQMYLNFLANEGTSQEQIDAIEKHFKEDPQLAIEHTPDFLPTFYSSDCMVTDATSLMAEYIMTGKPIVYCHKKDVFSELGHYISQGFYYVNNEDELIDTLQMLKRGEDPLFQKRQEIIKNLRGDKTNVGEKIKDIILQDAMK